MCYELTDNVVDVVLDEFQDIIGKPNYSKSRNFFAAINTIVDRVKKNG